METPVKADISGSGMPRRSFLRYAGVGVASAGLLAAEACHKGEKVIPDNGIDIGSGDTGLLNYAYALEQLEAAFYTQVIATPYAGITAHELALLTSIRDHEIVHREFFKASLGANAIAGLTTDFSYINFNDRSGVLYTAQSFEETGVMAYDGVAGFIKNTDILTLLGKVVSVEARHAAIITTLLYPNYYAVNQVVNLSGLNQSQGIPQVLSVVNKYLKVKLSAASFNYIAP